jgi:hypothetical protein
MLMAGGDAASAPKRRVHTYALLLDVPTWQVCDALVNIARNVYAARASISVGRKRVGTLHHWIGCCSARESRVAFYAWGDGVRWVSNQPDGWIVLGRDLAAQMQTAYLWSQWPDKAADGPYHAEFRRESPALQAQRLRRVWETTDGSDVTVGEEGDSLPCESTMDPTCRHQGRKLDLIKQLALAHDYEPADDWGDLVVSAIEFSLPGQGRAIAAGASTGD